MIIHLFCEPKSIVKTIPKLKKTGIFSNIIKSKYSTDKLLLETKIPLYNDENDKILKIQKTLREIGTIRSFTFYPFKISKKKINRKKITHKRNKPFKEKIRHIFFDIDSTLTHQGVQTLNNNVKETFERFMENNCSIYFCTGRSSKKVRELIKMYKTSPYGIAENGGIIINASSLPNEKFGDKTEPDKLINYLMAQKIPHRLDASQQSRKTEHIIIKNTLTKKCLNQAIRKSKAQVEVHTSKNTYHISKNGINKGSAIEYIISEEELGLSSDINEIIAVGDSDLDIPMFKIADSSYAVGNANLTVKKKAKYRLKNNPPKAIEELYNKLFVY